MIFARFHHRMLIRFSVFTTKVLLLDRSAKRIVTLIEKGNSNQNLSTVGSNVIQNTETLILLSLSYMFVENLILVCKIAEEQLTYIGVT